MGVDFDVLEFCKKLRLEKPPPYQCPLEHCERVYKSLCGLQYHLVKFEHDTAGSVGAGAGAGAGAAAPVASGAGAGPGAGPGSGTPRRKGRARAPNSTADVALRSPPREALTFAEAQKVVQFEIDGKISRITIDQILPVMSLEDWNKKNADLEKPISFIEPIPEPHIKLPEANFKRLSDYNISDAPTRPNAYIRFIEKSAEELDGEVEYDVDEEDTAWLNIINEKRQKQNLPAVPIDTLELLMDRLEKESYFQATQTGQSSGTVVDEDAVCCICMDGECQNTNVILFCDMCNLAVHQDCYGVPYIPEGQWLCRRCLQSPSRLVDCVLCPNTGGAFKQTDRGNWAHVVCALWIPEVRFANTVFLEPIDSIETIPVARWKLTCYICKQRGVGACIQCHRANCYAAFHVTCAQHAGLHMRLDAVNGSGRNSSLDASQAIHVAKIAFCDAHTPPGVTNQDNSESEKTGANNTDHKTPVTSSHKKQSFLSKLQARSECREKMKQARRLLAKKRSSVPVVLIPTIPPERVQEIASLVQMAGRAPFVQRLIAYWTLKRQYRNGVPLLRRLQSLSHHATGTTRSVQEGAVNTRELYNQLKYWQRIRQDLERARLLCELVRKRERMKAEFTRVRERWLFHQLKPVEAILRKLLNLLLAKDTSDIFSEPVDPTEVPDYSSVVTHPMDLSTMVRKLDQGSYHDLDALESDFNLMIDNCLAYNSKDTVFYKAGIKMMEQGRAIIKQARKDMIDAGFIEQKEDASPIIPKTPLKKQREKTPLISPTKNMKLSEKDDILPIDKKESPKNTTTRWKKSPERRIVKTGKRGRPSRQSIERRNANIARKRKHKKSISDGSNSDEAEDEDDDLDRSENILPIQTMERIQNKHSPALAISGEPSPTGVNRRTAVLFTRKAQSAAFSNLRVPRRPELAALSQTPSPTPVSNSSHLLPNGNEATLKSLAASVSVDTPAEPIIKKKGRGRPRKHKLNPADKSKIETDKNKTPMTSQAAVPASFLEYRGPRDEAGSGIDSDSARSTGSYSSSCSSCTHFDDDELSSCSVSCSDSSGTDRSSCFNETMESTTNQTMSDTETNVTRMSGKLSSSSDKKLIAPSHWSSDQSECNGSQSPIKGKRKNKMPLKSPIKLSKDNDISDPMDTSNLAALQLVWAKCRGYPWYPALIIDPKIPKGFVHNGVPLPVPPQDVLALKKNHLHEPILYLVLFFDAKRTWQWLPPNKLEPLGIKKAIDQAKLIESRKPTDRKAVKKAYQDAMQYNKQVDGEPFSNK